MKLIEEFIERAESTLRSDAPTTAIPNAKRQLQNAAQLLEKWQPAVDVCAAAETLDAIAMLRREIVARCDLPAADFIVDQVRYLEVRLRTWIREMSTCPRVGRERKRVENQCCMVSRTYYLTIQLAIYFKLVAYPEIWDDERHGVAIELHDEVIQEMTMSDPKYSVSKRREALRQIDLRQLENRVLLSRG
ncbi:MAG: hypothetical protein ACYSWU_11590 [Planctomycetota bacterium]